MSGASLRGRVEAVLRDPNTLRELRTVSVDNTLTDPLIAEMAKVFISGKNRMRFETTHPSELRTRSYWYMALGTGAGTPAPSDTSLFALVEASLKHGNILDYSDNGSVVYWARYMPEELVGYTFTEVGIYDMVPYQYVEGVGWVPQDYTSGTLINHAVLPAPIEKTGTTLLDVYVTIYLATA